VKSAGYAAPHYLMKKIHRNIYEMIINVFLIIQLFAELLTRISKQYTA